MAGYPQQAPGPTQQTVQWFQAVDQDRSGHINALELQRALVNGNMSQFSEEACSTEVSRVLNHQVGPFLWK